MARLDCCFRAVEAVCSEHSINACGMNEGAQIRPNPEIL
jgi:hypothetical protein